MDEVKEFSWTGLFFVTSFSSFVFSRVMKVLDGAHCRLLIMIGIIAFFAGLLNWSGRKLIQYYSRKRKNDLTS